MKHLLLVTTLLFFVNPSNLAASQHYRRGPSPVGNVASHPAPHIRHARPFKAAVQPTCTPKPGRQARHRTRPGKPCRGRPITWWPVAAPAAPEPEPVAIVFRPPPEPAPAAEPEKEWVPPVLATRTEPGYWDHPIRKIWMGDHWRFVQDFEKRRWVPEAVVTYVKQAGHWKTAD